MLSLAVAGAAGYTLFGLSSVLLRKLDPKPARGAKVAPAKIEQLEARVAELEQATGRLTELEERLDFAERLLAQQRQPGRLPGEG